jgi:Xaa-Pro dipeptidase
MDAGCEWKQYACDVTRTFPLSADWPTKESRAIYKLVEAMQDQCIEAIRPGVLFRSLQLLAHQIMVRGLLDLGILQDGSMEEIIRAGTSSAFLPHGLGHHLGLEVHDVEDASRPMTGYNLPLVENGLTDFAIKYKNLFQESCHAPATISSGGLRPGMVVTVEPGM